jgi:hypothetical protein
VGFQWLEIIYLKILDALKRFFQHTYRIYELGTRKFYVTLIEKYRKGNEYAYRIYELDTRKILCHTDRKISERVTNMRI